MIKLTEHLPDRITVRGKGYKLKPDYRNVLLMMETMAREDLIPEAKTYQALRHVIKRPPKMMPCALRSWQRSKESSCRNRKRAYQKNG